MSDVHVLAIDLAKRSFQVCGTDRGGAVLFNRTLSRAKLMQLLGAQPPCIVAMEACATSHYWGRFAQRIGHDVRLVLPIYVKPFVKRQKNDAADAAAIAEAVLRPNIHTRRGQERRASGARSRFPDAPMFCPPTHATDQCLAGSPGRIRAGCASRASPPQAVHWPAG